MQAYPRANEADPHATVNH